MSSCFDPPYQSTPVSRKWQKKSHNFATHQDPEAEDRGNNSKGRWSNDSQRTEYENRGKSWNYKERLRNNSQSPYQQQYQQHYKKKYQQHCNQNLDRNYKNNTSNSCSNNRKYEIDDYLDPSMLQDPWANLRKRNQ